MCTYRIFLPFLGLVYNTFWRHKCFSNIWESKRLLLKIYGSLARIIILAINKCCVFIPKYVLHDLIGAPCSIFNFLFTPCLLSLPCAHFPNCRAPILHRHSELTCQVTFVSCHSHRTFKSMRIDKHLAISSKTHKLRTILNPD